MDHPGLHIGSKLMLPFLMIKLGLEIQLSFDGMLGVKRYYGPLLVSLYKDSPIQVDASLFSPKLLDHLNAFSSTLYIIN